MINIKLLNKFFALLRRKTNFVWQHTIKKWCTAQKEKHLIPTVKYRGGLLMLWSRFVAGGCEDHEFC